ncbi:7464_t:CDS:2, partial [Paraglomus occultum]
MFVRRMMMTIPPRYDDKNLARNANWALDQIYRSTCREPLRSVAGLDIKLDVTEHFVAPVTMTFVCLEEDRQ